jgi:hypothetical protein
VISAFIAGNPATGSRIPSLASTQGKNSMSKHSETRDADREGEDKRKDELPARENSKYAKDKKSPPVHPEEKGDYCDPVKDVTGRGNASKGPWKEQGGAGHPSDYGARNKPGKKD